jgi:hypothetical protein
MLARKGIAKRRPTDFMEAHTNPAADNGWQ